MTQEVKQLLLKDLCARVPYHPKGHVVNARNGAKCDEWLTCATFSMFTSITNNCRLYLRPMSSMTEEEKDELKQEHIKDEKLFAECITKAANGDSSMRGKVVPHFAVDWCNKNHFDYRGLIPMGLALEAPDNMYCNLKNK